MKTRATTADAYRLIHDGALALARAERQGIRVDTDYCERKKTHLTRKINYLFRKIETTKFFRYWQHVYGQKTNIHSNHQLSRLLYKNMKLQPPRTTDSGEGSTDEDALRQLGIPELDVIIQIRKLTKIKNTYLEAFIREQWDGYLHPSFNLHTARTYRSSSDRPNFQNIPKRDKEAMRICRRALLPRPGHQLIEMDFSSLEVMISACYHKDPVMLAYLEDDASDMHLDIAKQIFLLDEMDKSIPAHYTLRQAAKNGFVFPQFYGDYFANNARHLCDWVNLPVEGSWSDTDDLRLPDSVSISQHLQDQGIGSFKQFENHLKEVEEDFWQQRFHVYDEWRKSWVTRYRKKGQLQMLTGFVCSGPMGRNEITNYPIQGTAFHCLLKTLILLDNAMLGAGWDSKIIGQIHDSIIMDVNPDELDRVKRTIHQIVGDSLPKIWNWIIVPLEIEVEEYGVDQPWIEGG